MEPVGSHRNSRTGLKSVVFELNGLKRDGIDSPIASLCVEISRMDSRFVACKAFEVSFDDFTEVAWQILGYVL